MEKKITKKEYQDLFKAMANLYGIIDSDEIYILFNKYYEKVLKKDIEEKLKELYEKPKRDYVAIKIIGERNKYLLVNHYLNQDEFNEILDARENKPLYIPKTKEELLEFKKDSNMTKLEAELYNELQYFLVKRCKNEKKEFHTFMVVMYLLIRNRIDCQNENILELLNKKDFHFKDAKDIQKFLDLWMKVVNNTKIYPNKGYSPEEMLKISGPVDVNNLSVTLGPNMKDALFDNKMDPRKLLLELENSDLPKVAKESLKRELLNIIEKQEKNKA